MNRILLITSAVLFSTSALAGESCFQHLAATRGFSLGAPQSLTPLADGHTVLFLRSGPRDTKLGLYAFDSATGQERALAAPAASEHLSVEEKARRERMRMTLTGITDFAVSEDGRKALVSQGDKLAVLDVASGTQSPVTGAGWIAPRFAPDGSAIAAVRDNDLHVVQLGGGANGAGVDTQLTHGGSETLTNGLAEFAAAEELDRSEGSWWSPDGQFLVYEQADTSGVEKHFIADPEHPSQAPVEFRYPRAGTANAQVKLGVIARSGGDTVWLDWDRAKYPYVARVIWQKGGPLTLVLLNRLQTEEVVLSADPKTGKTTRLLTESDAAWINIDPQHGAGISGGKALPYWLADGSGFLWAAERNGQWQLMLRHADGSPDHAITSGELPFLALNDVDEATHSVVVTARPDRLDTVVYRFPLAGGKPEKLLGGQGFQDVQAGQGQHGIYAVQIAGADGSSAALVVDHDGKQKAVVPSHAEKPDFLPQPQFLTVGDLGLDALVIHPRNAQAGKKYPVVLSVYAGPTVKLVHRTPRAYLEDQCLADQGFIVATIDGRGTPGRDHDFERATKFDLIDLPLQDQVAGLQGLAKKFPDMDMSRVGVTGWSFGGYFTAMATIRRPDVFKAGVAGAPPADFADYDTAYTERYLGLPQDQPKAYAVSNVLTYAAQLSRPLLIMHGLTDDNVYFENTVKLTQAFIKAGKPYNLLLLPGTHLLPDPLLRARVDESRVAFLKQNLH